MTSLAFSLKNPSKNIKNSFSLLRYFTQLKSFVKITWTKMTAILIVFYYNDASILLASFSSYRQELQIRVTLL